MNKKEGALSELKGLIREPELLWALVEYFGCWRV